MRNNTLTGLTLITFLSLFPIATAYTPPFTLYGSTIQYIYNCYVSLQSNTYYILMNDIAVPYSYAGPCLTFTNGIHDTTVDLNGHSITGGQSNIYAPSGTSWAIVLYTGNVYWTGSHLAVINGTLIGADEDINLEHVGNLGEFNYQNQNCSYAYQYQFSYWKLNITNNYGSYNIGTTITCPSLFVDVWMNDTLYVIYGANGTLVSNSTMGGIYMESASSNNVVCNSIFPDGNVQDYGTNNTISHGFPCPYGIITTTTTTAAPVPFTGAGCRILPTHEIENQGPAPVMYLYAGAGLVYDTLFCNPYLLTGFLVFIILAGFAYEVYKKYFE
jgi:hypothetical protein